jgi:hypothetical protein
LIDAGLTIQKRWVVNRNDVGKAVAAFGASLFSPIQLDQGLMVDGGMTCAEIV